MVLTLREDEILRVSTLDDYCSLLGLDTVEALLSSEQLERIKEATSEEEISCRVEKDIAITFLENEIKAYVKAEQ